MSLWENGIAQDVEAQARKRESPDRPTQQHAIGEEIRHIGRLVTHKGIAQISDYSEDKGSKALPCLKKQYKCGKEEN